MHAFQNAGGHVGLSARPYPIETTGSITVGTVVKLVNGLVVKAAAKETGAILGIAAETHSGVEDMLNIRSNGEDIRVYDNPELIFECAAPKLTAADGSTANTLVFSDIAAGIADSALNEGKVQLVERAEGSTDTLNECRKVTGYTAASKTAQLSEGGVPAAGDVYCVYPPVGSAICAMDETCKGLILTDTGATTIMVVGHDTIRHKLRLKAVLHSLGTEN